MQFQQTIQVLLVEKECQVAPPGDPLLFPPDSDKPIRFRKEYKLLYTTMNEDKQQKALLTKTTEYLTTYKKHNV